MSSHRADRIRKIAGPDLRSMAPVSVLRREISPAGLFRSGNPPGCRLRPEEEMKLDEVIAWSAEPASRGRRTRADR